MKSRTGQNFWICLVCFLLCPALMTLAQTCDVDFPGRRTVSYSTVCGISSLNLRLGKTIAMADGDVFIFDSPDITIDGNFLIDAEGSGKIIVPAGVTVVVKGNFQLDRKNAGCTQANPCAFEIEVNGSIHFSQNLQNNLVNLIWSGSGSVVVDHHFENSTSACMSCSTTGCPGFSVSSTDCSDKGSGCSGQDFCAVIDPCPSDLVPPVIANCPANLTVYLASGCSQVVSWTPPSVSDNCKVRSVEATHAPGATFPKGVTTIVYTATDEKGNIATCAFEVNVVDSIAPVFTDCPTDITTSADKQCQAVVSWREPSFTDNCGASTVRSSHKPGDIFPIGTTQVRYTATDESGNNAVCAFNVIVRNETLPVISNCPKDVFVRANEEGEARAAWIPPSASTHCSEIVLVGSHRPEDVFKTGTTEVAYTATDNAGNAAYCKFNVVVADPEIQIGINQLITPDGDGINDEWTISNIEKYHDNEVKIVDRWGSLIYGAKGYNNENVLWKGADRNGQLVPAGTYFYAIHVNYRSSKLEKSGYIEVLH